MTESGPYQSIGIVGGGTAGYFAALAFRAQLPHLSVTLIESPEIPIIGVGEATTPVTVKFLHNYLKKDINELFKIIEPTWKLGLKFEWGLPGDYYFNYAFDPGPVLEGNVFESDVNSYSLGSLLMSADKVPMVREGGRIISLLNRVPFAYHLDNAKFVEYLKDQAEKDGVERVNGTISEVKTSADGEEVTELVLSDGTSRSFDLYIDCSGYGSLLLEKAVGSEYLTFKSSLFTDSAIVANVPHGGDIKPYTRVESMESGWCWGIPTVESDHRGYVFSSDFISPEDAEAEMRSKNPGMSDITLELVKFRSGRHSHFWKGNVVGMGNAYAFVEPLESTGLHMIIHEINQLILNFPSSKADTAIKRIVNQRLNDHWDSIRWYLALHYKFNRRFNTPFWETCRNDTDISGAQDRVDIFQERAPLTYRQSLFHRPEEIFSDFGYDVLLLGQKVEAKYVEPGESRADYAKRTTALKEIVSRAVTQAEAIQALRNGPPELLESVVSSEGTWGTWP